MISHIRNQKGYQQGGQIFLCCMIFIIFRGSPGMAWLSEVWFIQGWRIYLQDRSFIHVSGSCIGVVKEGHQLKLFTKKPMCDFCSISEKWQSQRMESLCSSAGLHEWAFPANKAETVWSLTLLTKATKHHFHWIIVVKAFPNLKARNIYPPLNGKTIKEFTVRF